MLPFGHKSRASLKSHDRRLSKPSVIANNEPPNWESTFVRDHRSYPTGLRRNQERPAHYRRFPRPQENAEWGGQTIGHRIVASSLIVR